MKILLMKLLCTCFVLGASLLDAYGAENARTLDSASLAGKNFKGCTFDFSDSTYFSHLSAEEMGRSIGGDSDCGIRLDPGKGGRFTSRSAVWVSMRPLNQLGQVITSQGFYKDKSGNWKFKGNPLWINFTGFKKLSFQEERSGDDFILIGRQIETGRDQAGTPIVFEGVHILRITPSYLVSMDLPFDVDIPSSTRDNVVNDMIKIVESVHVTASHLPVTQ